MYKYDKWYIIGKLLCSANKNANLQIFKFFAKFSKIVKKKSPKNGKIFIFKIPSTIPFQICKKFSKIFNNPMCKFIKLIMCKFLLTGCMEIICKNSFSNLVQSVPFWLRLSKKLKIIKIWQLKVGLLQEKVGIQAVCRRTQAVSLKARV